MRLTRIENERPCVSIPILWVAMYIPNSPPMTFSERCRAKVAKKGGPKHRTRRRERRFRLREERYGGQDGGQDIERRTSNLAHNRASPASPAYRLVPVNSACFRFATGKCFYGRRRRLAGERANAQALRMCCGKESGCAQGIREYRTGGLKGFCFNAANTNQSSPDGD
jgi:hypothetical protein